MDTSDVTRFEIIDHTPCEECEGTGIVDVPSKNRTVPKMCQGCDGAGVLGRIVYAHNQNLQFDVELQDEGRTLKVFIHDRYTDKKDSNNTEWIE